MPSVEVLGGVTSVFAAARSTHLWIYLVQSRNSNSRALHQSPGILRLCWLQGLLVLLQTGELHENRHDVRTPVSTAFRLFLDLW